MLQVFCSRFLCFQWVLVFKPHRNKPRGQGSDTRTASIFPSPYGATFLLSSMSLMVESMNLGAKPTKPSHHHTKWPQQSTCHGNHNFKNICSPFPNDLQARATFHSNCITLSLNTRAHPYSSFEKNLLPLFNRKKSSLCLHYPRCIITFATADLPLLPSVAAFLSTSTRRNPNTT